MTGTEIRDRDEKDPNEYRWENNNPQNCTTYEEWCINEMVKGLHDILPSCWAQYYTSDKILFLASGSGGLGLPLIDAYLSIPNAPEDFLENVKEARRQFMEIL